MSDPEQYMIAWICAINIENVAAISMLDKRHDRPTHLQPNDSNCYTLGEIAGHNVVIATLPSGEYGTAAAACVARDLVRSFPNVRLGLMVGVGGGVPTRHDIRLGDVVVSNPGSGNSGLFQYDFGNTGPHDDGQIYLTGHLEKPPVALRTAVANVRAHHDALVPFHEALEEAYNRQNKRRRRLFRRPSEDLLYQSHVIHPLGDVRDCRETCGVGSDVLRIRDARDPDIDGDPKVHYGLIASGNCLIKNAALRDRLAAGKDVLCFEMEAAGLANHFPCLVVRGICDYADSHKNKAWQAYAAFSAAVYASQLLEHMVPSQVATSRKVADILNDIRGDIKCLMRQEKRRKKGCKTMKNSFGGSPHSHMKTYSGIAYKNEDPEQEPGTPSHGVKNPFQRCFAAALLELVRP